MKEIKILSSKYYNDKDYNHGDCILLNTGKSLIVYDCGSEEHANEVMKYMDKNNYDKADFILSHNDRDHFDGLPILIANNRINRIVTTLLYKHVNKILDELDDGRFKKETIIKKLSDIYDNISRLSGNNLLDIITDDIEFDSNIEIVGPNYDYLVKAVSKGIDTSESDYIDEETIINATSVQISVKIWNEKMLLAGDAPVNAINEKIKDYGHVLLMHHGKKMQAIDIFDICKDKPLMKYYISDNTGSSNGGSDKLSSRDTKGKHIENTLDGEITINENNIILNEKGTYGC